MPRRRHTSVLAEPTKFLNVDLDVEASFDLTKLAEALEPRLFALHVVEESGVSMARFEVAYEPDLDLEATLRRILAAVARLPPRARAQLMRARRRCFSIGVQAGTSPHAFERTISAATLRRIAELKATLELVLYAPER